MKKRTSGAAAAVLLGTMAAGLPAAAFQDGELYMLRDVYPAVGAAIVKVSPQGDHELFADLPWPGGQVRKTFTYDPYRNRLFGVRWIVDGGLYTCDANGELSFDWPTLSSPWLVAARGDGLVYLFDTLETWQYLDANDVVHTLMDSTGTAPFLLGVDFWDEMIYDPGTNSLFLGQGDLAGNPQGLCPDHTQSCFLKLPLSADGTRVVGPVTGTQLEVVPGIEEDDVVGSGFTPSGFLSWVIDTNISAQHPRMQLMDPETMALTTYASNGPYLGANSLSAGTYSTLRGEFIVFGWLDNRLRAFGSGAAGAGVLLGDPLGNTFEGALARLLEIRGAADPTGAPVTGEAGAPARSGLRLSPAAPNPFSASTSVEFALSRAAEVRIRVVDASGRAVRTLVREARSAGSHTVSWDGRDDAGQAVAAGIYFLQVEAEGERHGVKLARIRP